MGKIAISTNKAPNPVGNYSQAVSSKDFIFISGQIGIIPDSGKLCSQDFKEQLNQVFLNISAICASCGCNLDDVIKMTVYLTDLTTTQILNKSIEEFFCQPYPARAVVGASNLPLGSLVEIETVVEKK